MTLSWPGSVKVEAALATLGLAFVGSLVSLGDSGGASEAPAALRTRSARSRDMGDSEPSRAAVLSVPAATDHSSTPARR